MNWFSNWDEDLEDKTIHSEVLEDKTAVNVDNFELPTEEEINELFGCDNTVDYKVKWIENI